VALRLLATAEDGRLEPFDLELARETYLMAWASAAHVAGGGPLVEICRAIRALPPPPGAPRPIHLLLDGLALLTTDGRAAATPTLKRAVKALAGIPVEDVLRWGWVAPGASAAIWDFEGNLAIYTRQVQLVRDAGALAALPWHLTGLGLARMWMGDFAGASSLVAESDSVAAATGEPLRALHHAEAPGAARKRSRGFRGDYERDREDPGRGARDGGALGALGGR
jgi:hypothetical protein